MVVMTQAESKCRRRGGGLRPFGRDRIQGLEEFDRPSVGIGTQPLTHVVGSLHSGTRRHWRGRCASRRPAPVHHSSPDSFPRLFVLSVQNGRAVFLNPLAERNPRGGRRQQSRSRLCSEIHLFGGAPIVQQRFYYVVSSLLRAVFFVWVVDQ